MENIEYVRPQDIEKRSFAIISKELEEKGIVLPKEQELVTKRAIHTSADFDYAKTMTYSAHAVGIAKKLIQNQKEQCMVDIADVIKVLIRSAQVCLLLH